VTATGERRVRRSGWHGGGPGDGAVSEKVGATVAHARRSGGGREARSEGGRHERGRLSGCVVHGSHAATARCRAGPARRLTGGARSSVISELKITPEENSSKQIARD
jgi:hypothetical protein